MGECRFIWTVVQLDSCLLGHLVCRKLDGVDAIEFHWVENCWWFRNCFWFKELFIIRNSQLQLKSWIRSAELYSILLLVLQRRYIRQPWVSWTPNFRRSEHLSNRMKPSWHDSLRIATWKWKLTIQTQNWQLSKSKKVPEHMMTYEIMSIIVNRILQIGRDG